jgi:hypothetical protein
MIDREAIRRRWQADGSKRDERGRRLFAASEARAAGWGGRAAVCEITGLAQSTIGYGLAELDAAPLDRGRVRRPGGGRKIITLTDPTVVEDLRRLVEPATMGDPMRPLLWVSKSYDKLAAQLAELGHGISPNTVGRLLADELEFSRQANRKTLEGSRHPDRNAQFEHINAKVLAAGTAGQPVISVDTKKKELVGNFKNAGREWHPQGEPELVDVHDFPSDAVGKAIPYGVYDLAANDGFVSVGVDHDTPVFAVTSIEAWWTQVGSKRYPKAREIFITADAGGSNSYRSHLWKHQLQRVADKLGMSIRVSHFPPGTSKWNKVEHRLFSFISINWRGRPLRTYQTVINLIGNTSNRGGLVVRARLDRRRYPTGKKVSKRELRALKIEPDDFHGEWNYLIKPRKELH